MTGCGGEFAEAIAVAIEDFDFDEKILHVRRQLKKLGREHIYALPKNDRELRCLAARLGRRSAKAAYRQLRALAVLDAVGEAHWQAADS